MRSINPLKASKISLGVPNMWLMGNFTTHKPSTPKKSEVWKQPSGPKTFQNTYCPRGPGRDRPQTIDLPAKMTARTPPGP